MNGSCLPPATDSCGQPIVANFGYARRKGSVDALPDPNFKPYVVDEVMVPRVTTGVCGGKSASDKARLRHGRILMKQSSAARATKREAKFQRAITLRRLIDEFIDDDSVKVEANSPDSDEEFWLSLPAVKPASFANLAEHPKTYGSMTGKQSRMQRLGY